MRTSILIAVVLAAPLSAATIDVRVTTRSGAPVENAVVYAVPAKPMPLVQKVAVMDQINRTFVPHVLPVQTGTWVEFPNSDNTRHQVFSASPARKFSTPLYIGKPARPIQFPAPGVVAIGCSIHEQMSAYIVVVDTPYFATTDGSGKSAIANVDGGEYTFYVWSPRMKSDAKPQTLQVAAEGRSQVSFVAE
ncbi:MAG TPA: methylamine utilization protein [Thermoanaerobaculia bacterium]